MVLKTIQFFCLSFLLQFTMATAQVNIKVNAVKVDDSFDNLSSEKLIKAAKMLEDIFKSERFARAVLHTNFNAGANGLTNAEIYQLIVSGKDHYEGKSEDNSIDLRVRVYDKYKGGGEYGNTQMTRDIAKRITSTHRCYVLNNATECYASHLAHEYMHQIGFYDVKSWKGLKYTKTNSVPYKIGNIVDSMLAKHSVCTCRTESCVKSNISIKEVINTVSINDSIIFYSFSQNSANNCVSIALIKAAILKYGYKNIFACRKKKEGYLLTLRDGTEIELSEEELSTARNKYANFNVEPATKLGGEGDSILHYTFLAYAAIAKNIAKNGYWGCNDEKGNAVHYKSIKNYSEAINFISRTGYCADNCYKLLGLKIKGSINNFQNVNDLRERGTILYSWKHAVAVYNKYLDCYGLPDDASVILSCDQNFKWYIILE